MRGWSAGDPRPVATDPAIARTGGARNGRAGAIRRTLGAALLVLGTTLGTDARSASLEVEIKATYLVKFGGFVVWPNSAFASPSSPLVICVEGADPFGAALDRAASGQTVGPHAIEVRRLGAGASGAGCHMLFLAGGSGGAARGPVLTVTDLPPRAPRKGIINFVVDNNHVRFEIDDRAATASGLRISSQLLALAVGNHSGQ